MELIFSSFKPALNLAMKVSALVLTSGLGQNNGWAESPPSVSDFRLVDRLGPLLDGDPM